MNQAYFNGDFYQCVTATSAGESPTTTAAKWRKIKLLGKWRWVLSQLTYSHLLRLDGQTDKANVERSIAYGRDRVGLDDLVRQEANEERLGDRCGNRGRGAAVNTGRTRPVAASVILDDAYRLIGWDAHELDDREKQDARMALSQALQEVWEAWWWQELMVCEQTQFASIYDSTNATPVGQSYYVATEDIYIAALVTHDGDSAWPTLSYNYEEYDPLAEVLDAYSEDTAYVVGDHFTYGGIGYQCWADAPVGTSPLSTAYFYPMQNWNPILPYTAFGGASVGPFGPIRSVSKFDPRTSANPQPFELDVTEDGTRVMKMTVTHPWVWSRRVTPIITGDEYSATATYAATDPEDLVYDS